MISIRSLLVFLLLSGVAEAQTSPTTRSDLVQRIEAAEQAWLEVVLIEPLLVSLGDFPDSSDPDVELTSILRDRLKLLNKKMFSNRQWREHWVEQRRASAQLGSLYGELATIVTGVGERDVAAAKQTGAIDWTALAEAKVSNQDAYLSSIETERDSVEERLEGTLGSAVQLGLEATRPAPAQAGATPFEERAARIAELRFRQELQSERHAAAVFELKLVKQQAQSGVDLLGALKRDVELAREEQRIAKAQLLSSDPQWSRRWLPMAEAAANKVKKIEEELQLSEERQHSIEFEVSLAESKIAYRDRKNAEIALEKSAAEAFSGWVAAAVKTAQEQAFRVLATLLLIVLFGRLALWIVRLAARALMKVVEDDDPDRVSVAEQRANTIAAVLRGVGKIAVFAVGTVMVFDVVGINTGPIIGSVAILGLAISFGSQNLVRDLVNGFFILVENQYAVGDWVALGSHEGEVEQINIRSTRLRGVTGVLQIIPNGTITTVENMTREWACFRCHVGVSYDSDIDHVERICNEVGAAMYADPQLKEKLMEAPTFVGVTELGDSAVVVRSSAKTRGGAQWSLEREMNRRLKKAFEKAGIEIPFPQRVVWHRNQPGGQGS